MYNGLAQWWGFLFHSRGSHSKHRVRKFALNDLGGGLYLSYINRHFSKAMSLSVLVFDSNVCWVTFSLFSF